MDTRISRKMRKPCCDKATVRRGAWSRQEDDRLKDYIKLHGDYGGNWNTLPEKIGLNRCGKSCRLRWLNYLRPDIKRGKFSEEEENLIFSLYDEIGSRWSMIAAQLPGRTDNENKNHFKHSLKKQLATGSCKQSTACKHSGSSQDPKESIGRETLSYSAIEGPQLHMQLPNLANPYFSHHDNPPIWPFKLIYPVQENMKQTLQDVADTSKPLMFENLSIDTPQEVEYDPQSSNLLQKNGMGITIPESSCVVPESDVFEQPGESMELQQHLLNQAHNEENFFDGEIDEDFFNVGATSMSADFPGFNEWWE